MIPLTVRSHYSLMWGTAPVRRLCAHARAMGYHSLALTDTGNLYGLWPFLDACRDYGLRPIIGAEISDPAGHWRAVCLVKNARGYRNLCRLLTRRHRDKAFTLKDRIPELGRGLVILTQAPELLARWRGMNLDLAAALPRGPLSRTHRLCRMAVDMNIPMVATPGSFFLRPGDHPAHAMLRAIDKNTCLSRLGPRDLAPANAFLGRPDDYASRFAALPGAIAATHEIGERLEFQGPEFGIVMPPFTLPRGTSAPDLLREKTLAGARDRYGAPLPIKVVHRIDRELSVINQKNFAGYFLVVEDIVRHASQTCGRGSGAASIVAYCLGITNVCPIKHDLYFERFLNPGRQDPPDIDVDFAWDERDGILNRVLSQFKGHAAMVSSHILFQPRMAVRETAKVYGLPEAEIKKVTARLPWFWREDEAAQSLLDRIKTRPEFKDMDFPRPWPEIMAQAQALTGTPRHLSVHPGGVVITPDPIDTYVPVQTAPKGIPLIQWEKDSAEAAGLVKIDLLGNRSLGVIRDCIAAIRTTRGAFTDFQEIDPEDDPATQALVAQGQTMGCFYIESPAMRLLQKKSRVGDFAHLVIHSSIIRPAANEFIQQYLQRLHTGIWDPIHPLLGGLLDETFGIMVYQEDVSRVAVRLAGFTHAQADGLRKIMSKKDKHRELSAYHRDFINGARAKGVSPEETREIWEMIISFSGYSFCKPHSASYARVSFQAAYLKTHYPAEFMAAVISNRGGFYSTFAYVSEARRLGIKVQGPDIHASQISWTGSGDRLRIGFMAIKGLTAATMGTIIRERKTKEFSDLWDFFSRVSLREDECCALVHSGCLDRLNPGNSRAALLWSHALWLRSRQSARACHRTLPGLFDAPLPEIPDLPPDAPKDLIHRELDTLGLLAGSHPITGYAGQIRTLNTVKAADLHNFTGRTVTFAGWLITGKVVRTKQGDPMKFLTFEDETGIVETVFFPKPYARFCHILDYGKPFLLTGKVESDWGAVTLTVSFTRQIHGN
ncbi:MAG: DNA polymerase III subunit alpha [Desulfobacter sp.]|nr:MAG: DNA polymerase III subunit alpha [Desulfobacter sp.]